MSVSMQLSPIDPLCSIPTLYGPLPRLGMIARAAAALRWLAECRSRRGEACVAQCRIGPFDSVGGGHRPCDRNRLGTGHVAELWSSLGLSPK